jgi:DNA-binding PadR family transcriptional regulator
MPATRKLTELEGCVLGLVWAKGPCTAYALRKEFLDSPSPHWSGSAGAIYPLVERLERWRLIRSAPHAAGRRHSKRYVLTPGGLRRLYAWMGPPLSDETVGVPADPLRTRLEFLGALPPAQQAVFLAEAERGLREQVRRVEEDYARRPPGDAVGRLTARGALAALQARLEWIREVAREWDQGPRS